jgi:GMP reductase
MDGVGTFSMAKALADQDCLTAICKHEDIDKWRVFLNKNHHVQDFAKNAIFSAGMGAWRTRGAELARINAFFTEFPQVKMLCLDVANGYNTEFVHFVSQVRETVNPDTFIIAGNVVTPSQTENLINAGANAVKVGIGSGSVCTTRKVTGVGYPQLSAIIECADAAHGLHGFVVADGGCQVPGDVCKAFGAGADFVMLGGMLAAHDESEITVTRDPNGLEHMIPFYGSSSKAAQGELAAYRSSEGKKVHLQRRGPVVNTMNHILGGVRSCCTYVGAMKLKDLSKRTTFVRVYNGAQYNTVFGDSNEVT